MKIRNNLYNETVKATQDYPKLRGCFAGFFDSAQWLLERPQQFPGLQLEANASLDSFDLSYAGVTVKFSFIPHCNNDVFVGLIVVTKETPKITKEVVKVGELMFRRNGLSDIEKEDDEGKLDIKECGPEIVLHFWDMALRQPLA